MDIRPLTPDFAVSPQIAPEDCAAIAEAGFGCIICNRPDMEVPPGLQAQAIEQAAKAAGLAFHVLPITHQSLTPDNIDKQAALISASETPVLAYCASGTRSTMVWALGMAGQMPASDLIAAGAKAGYDLSGLKAALGG